MNETPLTHSSLTDSAGAAAAYQSALAPLTAVVRGTDPDAWDAASPCEGWSARDLLGHVIGTQRDFFAGRGIDLGPAPDLADPPAAWQQHVDRVAPVVADEDAMGREFDGHDGPSTLGATFARFYVFDMLVHRWDLAVAVGVEGWLTDDELDRIEASADSFGPALHSEGVCGPAVEPPAGADRQTRVLARLGRVAA